MSTFVVAFCFKRWMKEISVIKTYSTNILGDGDRSVFGAVWNLYWINWDALTSINFLYLAYWKHEHCSQQYSVSHVFVSIDCYRQHKFSCNFICFNFVYEFAVTLHFPHLCSKNCLAIGYFLFIPHFNSSFVLITNPINSLRKYLQACFCGSTFRFSSACPIVASPCWCRLWRTIKASCLLKSPGDWLLL